MRAFSVPRCVEISAAADEKPPQLGTHATRMQHAPTAISNTAFNRGVTPEAGAPGLCFGTLHFAFLTLYSGSIR